MNTEKQVQYWIDSANEDLETAKKIYDNGTFDWSLFIGHLALEKLLKAFYVNANKTIPPKIHRLDKLAELSNLDVTEQMGKQFKLINDFNISTRYPDYKNNFRKICTKEFAEEYLKIIENIFKWILKKLQS